MDTVQYPLLPIDHSSSFENTPGLRNEIRKRPKNKIPVSLKTWIVVSVILFMIIIAIAIEVALLISQRNKGFTTGQMNTEEVQWWSGFIPTLAIGPLVWIWRIVDNDLRRMQPYVTMSQGPTKPQQSVLLDLEHENIFTVFSSSLRYGHYLIVASSIICIINVLLHPIASSFFLVKPGITITPLPSVTSTASLGLNPSYKDVSSFVAAAGFAEAAAFHNLSDPPFIENDWAVAQFKLPVDIKRNSTIAVNTTAVLTNVNCSAPTAFSLISPTPSTTSNWTIKASLGACTITQSIDGSSAVAQYGVRPDGCSQNSNSTPIANPFASVLFWFYNVPQSGNGMPVASAVFCKPTIETNAVMAVVDGATGLLVDVTITGKVDPNSNNVTGAFAGKAFNGVSFDDSDFNLTDPFVNARAIAVTSGVPGVIFRVASDPNQVGSLDAVFGNATGFLGLTEKIYTQYLSLVALANYFTPANQSLSGIMTEWPNRLWINPRAAHLLSSLLFLVAAASAVIHIMHRRQRKGLYLASYPGSMAHYMSLLSNAGGAPITGTKYNDDDDDDTSTLPGDSGLVGPLDSDKTMGEKLRGMRFMLDSASGNIVVVPKG